MIRLFGNDTRRNMIALATVVGFVAAGSLSAHGQTRGGGSLNLVVASVDGEDFDPTLFRSAGQTTFYPLVFDALIKKDPETGELAPGLALSWDLDADGKSWILKLREGVKFHDGSDFTAEDAKFSLERYMGKFGAVPATGSERLANLITSVDMVDDHTIVIRSKDGAPTIPFDIASSEPGIAAGYMVPSDYVAKVGAEAFNKAPIGTGPFKFVSQDVGREMKFEANLAYWDTVPDVDALTLRIVPELAARMAQLRAGEADIMSGIVGPAIPQVEADSSLRVIPAPKGHIVYMVIGGMTNPDSPTSKAQVREAISLAIDRNAIVQHLLFGHGEPASLFSFPFAFGWPADADEFAPVYDPDKARQLLADAGHGGGFELTLYAATEGRDFAQAIAQYLETVGITVKLDIREISQVLAEARNDEGKQKPRLALIFGPTGSGARADTGGLLYTFLFTGESINQPHGDEELSQWVGDQAKAADPSARAQLISNVLKRARGINAIMPLYYVDSLFAAGPSVADWKPISGVGYPSNLNSVKLNK
ncbi:MAG: ABC transporter substrate-binding protein [Alphaproteobacteria bacterium]|nr:MAG: ABC transporter substrate-binding protein [Alphaproteobacteria bacterium]